MPRLDALDNVMLPMVYAGVPLAIRRQRAQMAPQAVGLEARLHHRPNEMTGWRCPGRPAGLPDTGFRIADDAIWTFFSQHGGSATFGEPISREFTLLGQPVQLFQHAALQVQPDGSVQAMQLTDPSLMPYMHLNGLTVPAADPALALVSPTPEQPNYPAPLQVFLQSTVPDIWSGQPVQFWSTYAGAGGSDVWGLPTSAPAADPNNPHFVYQRFRMAFCCTTV